MEALDAAAVGAGAFGKKQDRDAGLKDGGDLLRDGFGAGAVLAIDEEGSGGTGEEAEEGPAADFNFGDKDAGDGGGADEDIEVTEVVGAD